MKTSRWWTMLAVGLMAPAAAHSQGLMTTALSVFPPQTVHVEYSNSSKLRSLSDYASLRNRYLAPRLKQLETSMGQLGVHEDEVEEIVLGWRAGDEMYGVVSGGFDSQAMATGAANKGIKPTMVASIPVYCLEATCLALTDPSTGYFGSLSDVKTMLKPGGSHLDGDADFSRLVDDADQSTPIWGVAKGPSVVDWFKSTMPGQDAATGKLDWSSAFKGVNALSYSVDAGDSVKLAMKLDCASAEAAANLRQLFEGLRLLQRMAWQSKNPTLPNPYESLTVDTHQSEVSLKLETPHSALAGFR